MTYDINDEWVGSFRVTELGGYPYTVRAWVDPFATWQSDLRKKMEAGQNIAVELRIGGTLLRQATRAAEPADVAQLTEWASLLESPTGTNRAAEAALGPELAEMMRKYADKSFATMYPKELAVVVDRYIWQGATNYVELDPSVMPAHILRVQKRLRREMDFDYFT